MKNITASPLSWPTGWPRTEETRESNFHKRSDGWSSRKVSIGEGTAFTLDELRKMGIDQEDVIISTDLRLRLDGLPYSNQRQPDDKGAAVYFRYQGNDMVIACDTFDKIGCNLHAIAKTIEAMRGIERWGCSELLNRAFVGFKALPEHGTETNHAGWWEVLQVSQDANEEQIQIAYKYLAKKYHPDKPDGDAEKFVIVKKACDQALSLATV